MIAYEAVEKVNLARVLFLTLRNNQFGPDDF